MLHPGPNLAFLSVALLLLLAQWVASITFLMDPVLNSLLFEVLIHLLTPIGTVSVEPAVPLGVY